MRFSSWWQNSRKYEKPLVIPGFSVLNSKKRPPWASGNSSIMGQTSFSLHWSLPRCLLLASLLGVWFSVLAWRSLQISGCSLHRGFISQMNLRSCWFFSLFSFLLIIRAECQLPRFLHASSKKHCPALSLEKFLKMFQGTSLTCSHLFSGVPPEMF